MFHHNQIFDITCGKTDLEYILVLAMHFADARNESIALTSLGPDTCIVGTCPSEGWEQPGPMNTYELAAYLWQRISGMPQPEPPDLDGRMEPAVRAMSLYTAQQAGLVPAAHELPEHIDPDDVMLVLVPAWLADAK